MEERWGFLVPWCDALNKRFDCNHFEFEDDPHGSRKRRLIVTLPMRKLCSDEEDFRMKFQKVREGLQLLSAVAHVDQKAWKFLLTKYCGVYLGQKGDVKYEEELSANFLLLVDLEEREKDENEEQFDSDLVEFCGIAQRKIQSEEFIKDLQKIAVLDERLKVDKPGVEVEIPVRVLYRAIQPFTTNGYRPVEDLVKAARAEKVIKTEWDAYSKEKVEFGSLRCTFVLEPMIADFNNFPIGTEMVETLSALLHENVRFSRVTLNLRIDPKLEADEVLTRKTFGQLVTSIFGNERRSPEIRNRNGSALRWKWLAYALFSKNARESSALEALKLIPMGSMTAADMEAVKAVVAAEHPEEEMYGTARGKVDERNALLATGAQIKNLCGDFEEQSWMFDIPTTSVRTFSDDGLSEWVNAILPGYGRCTVRRCDLAFEQDVGNIQRGITSLTIGYWDVNTECTDGIDDLLESIGPSLKVLALDAEYMCMELDIVCILQSCPNLKELSLRSEVVDMRFNFEEWQHNNLPLPDLDIDWTDIIAVTTKLQDGCSSFTKSLRRLRVRLNNVSDTREEPAFYIINAIAIGLLQMLKVNQNLEYLDVIADPEFHVLLEELKMYHLKPISRSIPLSMLSKGAFLSVFSSPMPTKMWESAQ
ncbi:hypothetical protein PHMEG_0004102 [Phytophthora megakarya]|uniref:Uncharacterized protein n=1 Tax=Phytophthora megakarya TaxID=4795 RepID=A0A225WUJ7_9STRA|nr:hypothetical protein PHMEG_0004102 [Phytophthora megakarya]